MEAIIINAEEWRTLVHKIDRRTVFIDESAEQPQSDSSLWLNDVDVCEFLKISTKTLYRLHSK